MRKRTEIQKIQNNYKIQLRNQKRELDKIYSKNIEINRKLEEGNKNHEKIKSELQIVKTANDKLSKIKKKLERPKKRTREK